MVKLTALQVRNAKSKEKSYKLSDGYGLHFHVAKSGKRTWRYRYKIGGTESTYVLGEYPQMSLEKARTARMTARELVKEGKNPAHERREKIKAVLHEYEAKENSFEKITLEWIEKQNERRSGDHSTAVFKSLKTNVFPFIGHE